MKTVRLETMCEKIGSGATPRGGAEVYLSSGIALIRSQNVYNDGFHSEGLAYIREQHARELENVVVEPDDVLLNITGDSVARCCQVPRYVLPARVNQHVAIIRPRRNKLNPAFLRYYLVAPSSQRHLLSLASAGATRNALTKGMIGDLHVPCPTLSEQSTIATILGTLDDKIELNRRMNETLEAIARAIFKSWFVDFDPVRAKAEGGQPAITSSVSRLFPRRFVLGVPEGWSYQELQTWCDSIDNGGTPKRMVSQYWDNGAIPWFKTGELKDCPLIDSEEHISEIGLRESACSLWPIGTILVALYASPTVGRLGILAVPGAANQACSALQISSAYGNHFAFHSLLSIRDELQRVAVGAAQQNISQQVLRKHRVLSPTKEIAKGFSDLVDPLWQKQTQNLRESGTLASLRDVLLPKLLSGEIRVKEAEKAVEAVV